MVPLTQEFWKSAATAELPELGPGPRAGVLGQRELEGRCDRIAAAQGLTSDTTVRLRATALLYHDHHDPAHDLVQDLSDRDGALIHAILHRREPDYWNAKYWFRRVDLHPIYRTLGLRINHLSDRPEEETLVRQLTMPGSFDPFAFVDLCEQMERRPNTDSVVLWLRKVQHAEFEELVQHLVTS